MSYGLNNSGIVFLSVMSQSLTSSVVTGDGSFDAVLRNMKTLFPENLMK